MPENIEETEQRRIFLDRCWCGGIRIHPEETEYWKCSKCKSKFKVPDYVPRHYWILVKNNKYTTGLGESQEKDSS